MPRIGRSRAIPILLATLGVRCTSHVAVPADTLVVALGAEPATLDPRFATDANGMRIGGLIFESLVKLGANLEPVPEAAKSWTYKDHKYTFQMRDDLQFHNGRRVSKEDLEFSFAQFLKPGSAFSSMLDIIKNVEVKESPKGALSVILTLGNFSDKFLKSDLPGIKILPKAEILDETQDFATHLIGTGGFKFKTQSSNEIELEGVRARSKHLIFKIIRDDFTRYQKILKGEIDIAQMEITADKVSEFQKHPDKFKLYLYPGLNMAYVLINFRDPLLQKREVREALARSLERSEIIRYKMNGLGSEATSLLTPMNFYFNHDLKNPPFDLKGAAALIQKLNLAGHELILKTSNAPQAVDNGKVLAYQLSRSGLKVQVQSYEWSTFYNDVKTGHFQLATMRWVGMVDPELYRLAFHSSEKPPGRNRGSYANKQVDRLLDEASLSENTDMRRQLFLRVQALVQDDLAILPLWYEQQIAISKQNVLNYSPNQTGDFQPLLEASKAHE